MSAYPSDKERFFVDNLPVFVFARKDIAHFMAKGLVDPSTVIRRVDGRILTVGELLAIPRNIEGDKNDDERA